MYTGWAEANGQLIELMGVVKIRHPAAPEPQNVFRRNFKLRRERSHMQISTPSACQCWAYAGIV